MGARPNLEAVIQALESQLDTIKNYYDRTSGDVVMISEEFGEGPADIDQQTDRFLLIPPLTNNDLFQIMEDFIEDLPNAALQEELNLALIEKGAFQRFDETLKKYPTRFEQWRKFRVDKILACARAWLIDNGIEP
jgi:hypothetical protein